jgi:ABC-type nitrate/sulfonate/bicarbonate transport system permease component
MGPRLVAAVNRAYYDVARNLGAKSWYLISRIAIPSALPHKAAARNVAADDIARSR